LFVLFRKVEVDRFPLRRHSNEFLLKFELLASSLTDLTNFCSEIEKSHIDKSF